MSGWSDAVENAILNQVLKGTDYSIAAATHVSLHTADPSDAAGSSEVTGGSYARQTATWGTASGGVSTLSGALSFTGMPASTVTHFGIWTASSGGVFLGGGTCTTQVLSSGATYTLGTSTTFTQS